MCNKQATVAHGYERYRCVIYGDGRGEHRSSLHRRLCALGATGTRNTEHTLPVNELC